MPVIAALHSAKSKGTKTQFWAVLLDIGADGANQLARCDLPLQFCNDLSGAVLQSQAIKVRISMKKKLDKVS